MCDPLKVPDNPMHPTQYKLLHSSLYKLQNLPILPFHFHYSRFEMLPQVVLYS